MYSFTQNPIFNTSAHLFILLITCLLLLLLLLIAFVIEIFYVFIRPWDDIIFNCSYNIYYHLLKLLVYNNSKKNSHGKFDSDGI